jgi:acetyl esterase/lipase
MTADSAVAGMSFDIDVRYGVGGGSPLLLDIVRPDPLPAEPMPAVVWIHGGGWRSGDKHVDTAQSIGLDFIRDGFACLSINYRLSDEALYPAQIHDAKAAIRWLRANAADLGVDPDRIGVWGHSAGAHLVSLLGASGDVAELEGESGSAGVSSRVQAVVAISPPSDFRAIPEGWPHEEPLVATTKLVGGPLEEHPDLVRLANPITFIRPNAPPFLIFHGEDDEVVPFIQAEMLHEALIAAGAEATFVRLPKANHMLEAPALGIDRREAWIDAGQRAHAFFRSHLLV